MIFFLAKDKFQNSINNRKLKSVPILTKETIFMLKMKKNDAFLIGIFILF